MTSCHVPTLPSAIVAPIINQSLTNHSGIYYVGTGAGESLGLGAEAFYWSTVVGRLFLAVAFTGLVLSGKFPEGGILLVSYRAVSCC